MLSGRKRLVMQKAGWYTRVRNTRTLRGLVVCWLGSPPTTTTHIRTQQTNTHTHIIHIHTHTHAGREWAFHAREVAVPGPQRLSRGPLFGSYAARHQRPHAREFDSKRSVPRLVSVVLILVVLVAVAAAAAQRYTVAERGVVHP